MDTRSIAEGRKINFKAGSQAKGTNILREIKKILIASPQHEKEGGAKAKWL